MVRNITFCLAILFGGAAAFLNSCAPQRCSLVLAPKLESNFFYYLNAGRFQEACPDLLEFIQCLQDEFQTCANTNFEDMAASDDIKIASLGKIALGSSKVVIDLCDENTKIHKDFIENIDCIVNTIISNENKECKAEADSIYAAYTGGRDTESNPECLLGVFAMACASGNVNEKCGEVARHTFLDIAKRTNFIQNEICSSEDIVELKTEYMEFLQLEGERKNIFEQAFDLRKKK